MKAYLLDLKQSWLSLPAAIKAYLSGYFFIIFLIVFWVPANDFDTMSSYLARIKLEEFGDLHQTATLELQYLFPKFFDYLAAPFLKLGYFITLPSLAVSAAAFLALCAFFDARERKICALFIMLCPPILVGLTSMKNDLPLAAFAVLAWFCIFVRANSPWYPGLSLLSLCALAGTKWHGFFLILPLGIGLIVQLCTTHRPNAAGLAVALLLIPAYWYVGSGTVYLDNYLQFHHSFTPKPYWLISQPGAITDYLLNSYRFVSSTVFDTFDIPLYLLDRKWKLWHHLQAITAYGKQRNYAFIIHSETSVFGVPLLFVLYCNAAMLLRRHEPRAVKAAAATSLVYLALVLYFVPYSTWTARYLIASYLTGLVAAVRYVRAWQPPKWALYGLLAYAFVMSMQALLLNQEKRMIPVVQREPDGGPVYHLRSMFPQVWRRDRMYFQVFGGGLELYQLMQKEVKLSDGLVFLDKAIGGDVPFLYPFIKDRLPANTRILSAINGGIWDPRLCSSFPYVLVYKGMLDDAHYDPIYFYDDLGMALYRRNGLACDKMPPPLSQAPSCGDKERFMWRACPK